jgi:hypothetical protein
MSNLEDSSDNEVEDTLTLEEQQKIDAIQHETFIKPLQPKEEQKPFNIWSIFGFGNDKPVFNPADLAAAIGTQINKPFNIQNVLYLDKSVIINNISGKNAYVVLTPAPITTLSSFGLGAGFAGMEASIEASLDSKGEYKSQKLSILNNTSSRCELDNTKFCCTLFFDIDGEWRKSWDNRRFNGKKFNLNILEKHVTAALKKDSIPDF